MCSLQCLLFGLINLGNGIVIEIVQLLKELLNEFDAFFNALGNGFHSLLIKLF